MKTKDLVKYLNDWYDPDEEVMISISWNFTEEHKNYPAGPIKKNESAIVECMPADEYTISHGYLGLYADVDANIVMDQPQPYDPVADELPF